MIFHTYDCSFYWQHILNDQLYVISPEPSYLKPLIILNVFLNFKHSDLHIIGLRASFWSRTLHKLVIPFIQAHKKWYLIEMAFWRYQTKKFSFFLNNFTALQRLNLCILRVILSFILNVSTFLTENISVLLHTNVPNNSIFKMWQGIQYCGSDKRIILMVTGT